MQRFSITITIFSMFLGMAACSSSSPSKPIIPSIALLNAPNDHGKTVNVRFGDTIELTLHGNPSTGYQWEVNALDTAILRQDGEPTFVPDSDAIGAGGKMTFRFVTAAVGQTPLTLIYHRIWEQDVPPIETFEATIIVSDK